MRVCACRAAAPALVTAGRAACRSCLTRPAPSWWVCSRAPPRLGEPPSLLCFPSRALTRRRPLGMTPTHHKQTQVWFKHDLRVADNPGLLAAAATGAPLLPVFCLSPRLYSQLSLTPGGPAGALAVVSVLRPRGARLLLVPPQLQSACVCARCAATTTAVLTCVVLLLLPPHQPPPALLAGVTQLRCALRAAGSDLVVRLGCPEEHLPGLAAAAGASRIVLEREEESRCVGGGVCWQCLCGCGSGVACGV
jgi:hypothetical protein